MMNPCDLPVLASGRCDNSGLLTRSRSQRSISHMRGTYRWTGSLLVTCLVASGGGLTAAMLVGCGEAPPPPTGVRMPQRVGAGSMGQTESDALPVRPSSDSTMTPPASTPSAVPAEIPPNAEGAEMPPPVVAAPTVAPPAAAAQVISTCREERLAGCDAVYIRVVKSVPDICVQLVLDNCSENTRLGLGVTTPFSWKVSSGSVSTNKACALDDYEPTSQPALDGSGSLRWTEASGDISAVEFAIQLELSPPPESTLPDLIDVATEAALGDVVDCE